MGEQDEGLLAYFKFCVRDCLTTRVVGVKLGLMTAIAKQFREPHGLIGKVVGFIMVKGNKRMNEFTVALLDIQRTDRVLEVGFGPGQTLQKVAELANEGWVAGIDFSETMVQEALKRNAALIAKGRVELVKGDADSLPYDTGTFDKAYTINTIYFFTDPTRPLKEIERVLKPGGLIAVTITNKEDMAKLPQTRTDVFKTYSSEELVHLLESAGFEDVHIETDEDLSLRPVCALARKKSG